MTTNEDERNRLIKELEDFRKDFIKYKELVLSKQKGDTLTVSQEEEFCNLWTDLPVRYGCLKGYIEKYGGVALMPLQGGSREYEAFTSSFSYTPFHIISLTALLDKAITTIGIAIGNLNLLPSATAKTQDVTITNHPKAFIAHGGESIARRKLCEFLDALKVIPVIAEKEPSENRSVNEQVDWCLSQSDCAIILATKGDIDGKTGKWIPRGNILIEIGKVQERFPRKTVYLLEEDATYPSDVSEKVWERFTHEHMDRAFIKVAKELAAFGIIRAVKP